MTIGQFMPMAIVSIEIFDPPGNYQINNTGSWNFTVPKYESFFRVTLWGGGGPGYHMNEGFMTNGGNSTCTTLSLSANGGRYPLQRGVGGAGGSASGGDVNTSGANGIYTYNSARGGNSPNGGLGGEGGGSNHTSGYPGGTPGGGGGGGFNGSVSGGQGGGGGAGAYCFKEYSKGQVTPGLNISGNVGAGGVGGPPGDWRGGDGGNGRIIIEWG